MKNKLLLILFAYLFALSGILSLTQAITAVINVSDYQWHDDNNTPINFFQQVFMPVYLALQAESKQHLE